MVEAYVKNALFQTLDAYLVGLRKDQINFSLMSGKGACAASRSTSIK